MKATTGETIAFARQVFAGPLEDRIKALEARNADLEYVLGRIDKAAKDSTTIIGFASKVFGMLGSVRAALSQQEETK